MLPSSSSAIIARKHASSSAIHDALNPSRGIRDDIVRRGGTPKNHLKENAKHLKHLQDQVRLKREQQKSALLQAQQRPSSSNSNKYRHVPSRLYLSNPTMISCSAITTPVSSAASSRNSSAPSIPLTQTPPMSISTPPDTTRKTKIGQVPNYLVQRKEQWAKEQDHQRQRQIELDTWPPGTVPIPEDERVATLQYLEQSHKELTLELSRFPITLGPHQVQKYKRHQEVLAKLREVEKGIEIYSQPRVFMSVLDSESDLGPSGCRSAEQGCRA